MKTRLIQPSDIERILELGREAHKESRYAKYPFSGSKCIAILNACLAGKETFCIVVEDEDQIVGFAVGYVVEHFFTTQLFAQDMLVYVTPEYRSRNAGSVLLLAFEDHVYSQFGNIPIMLGITTGVTPDKTGELYEFMGFNRLGSLHIKEN
jgi:GNAT superfamily N-acetyltransferase